MKARMTQLDFYKVNFTNIRDAYIQNIYYANNIYYIKLNMRMKTHALEEAASNKEEPVHSISTLSRKMYLNIGSTGVFLGDHVVGVNYFAKLMRKFLLRKCIKTVSVIDAGMEIEFFGATNLINKEEVGSIEMYGGKAELKEKDESKNEEKKNIKEELSKSERRAVRKSKKGNKSHDQSKNIVSTLLIENPHLKNIPVSDWKNHINTNTSTKKPLITNTIKDNTILRANKLIIKISPFNIIMYSGENEILGSLKPIDEKKSDESLLKFEKQHLDLLEKQLNSLSVNKNIEEIRKYLETTAIFLTEKEINLNQFVSVLYELHIKNSKTEITNFENFCKEFLNAYILYLRGSTEGTALYFKQESFYVPFKFENKKIDFLMDPIFANFLKTYSITFNSRKEGDEYDTVYKYKQFHENIDISIFNTAKCGGKLSDISLFSISPPVEYNELIKNFYNETNPIKISKPEKKKLNIRERAELSLKNLNKSLIEISNKMEFLENNTDRFERGLKLLNINLLESQIQEILKREINCAVFFKTRGYCELQTIENSFKYEIHYFEDLNENLKLLYDKKRKIQLKIKKTLAFLEGADKISILNLPKKNTKGNKKSKFRQMKVKEVLKSRILFWFEKYKFLITPAYLLVGGKNINQNEELIKAHLNESEFYLHPVGNGPSLLLIKNEIIYFGSCCKPYSVHTANGDCKKTAGDFMTLICKQKESFIVLSNRVSKVHMNERAKKGAFFINGPQEFLEGQATNLKFTIGFIERHCRECNKKRSVIYPVCSDTSVIFGFYSICLKDYSKDWLQFQIDCSVNNILETLKEEKVKKEVISKKTEFESYIQQTMSL